MDDRERRPEIESQRRFNAVLNSAREQLPGPVSCCKGEPAFSSRYVNEVIVRLCFAITRVVPRKCPRPFLGASFFMSKKQAFIF